jgi:hypothetical protein
MKFLFLFFVVIWVWVQMPYIALTHEIPVNKAITVIRSAERSLTSAKWQCKIEFQHRIPRGDNNTGGDSFVEQSDSNNTYSGYSVLYDCQRKLYLVKGKSRLEWLDGSHSRLSAVFEFLYNGDVYFSWQRSRPGNQLPEDEDKDYTIGSVSKDIDRVKNVASFPNTNGAYVGFGTGFPGQLTIHEENFYGSRSLSSLLEYWQSKKFPILIQELSSDKWLIEAKIPFLSTTSERLIRIHLLPKSGTVVFFSRVSQFRGKEYEEWRVEVTTIENSKGQVVPRIVRVIRPLDYLMDTLTFYAVEFNFPVQKEDFELTFPNNTYVKDFVAKKIYKVGDIIDEDKAISDFMTRYNLTGNVPAKLAVGPIFRYVLIIIGGLMILISLFLTIRKRWLKS